MSVFDEAASQRRALGAALRTLRQDTGLSGLAFSRQVGLAQSKVSRVELGQQVPSTDDLDRWLDATAAPAERREELRQLREQAATEAVAWRRHRTRGLATLQQEVAALEQTAGHIRVFHPVLVPGLLQTPAYAQAVYAAFHPGDRPDLPAAVAARMDRQAVLYTGKPLEFIVGEAALRWHFGPPAVTLGQLDRLRQVATLDNVTVALLPLDTRVEVWHSHGFTLYEDLPGGALVHVELLAGGSNFRDPEDVVRYAEAFKRLQEAAMVGEDALALLERVAELVREST